MNALQKFFIFSFLLLFIGGNTPALATYFPGGGSRWGEDLNNISRTVGNVGIGTTSPTAKLEVVGGPIKASGGFILENRTSDPASPVDGQMWLRSDISPTESFVTSPWIGGTGNISYSDGNVGIGTGSPNAKLQINLGTNKNIGFNTDTSGGTNESRISAFNDAVNASVPLFINGSYVGFQNNGAEVMRITSGNVGIGTTSPSFKLDVQGGRTMLSGNNEVFSLGLRYASNTQPYYIGATNSTTSADLVFSQQGGAERMRITESGNVGIGTTTPGAKLEVNGNVNISGSVTARSMNGQADLQNIATAACAAKAATVGTGSWWAAYQRGSYSTCNARCAATGSVYYTVCRGMISVRGSAENAGANPITFWNMCGSTDYVNYSEFFCCCSYSS